MVLEDKNGDLLGARIADDGQWRFPEADSLPEKYATCVIEFEDRSTGFFADITFRTEGVVECYKRKLGTPSELVVGPLDELAVRDFLDSKIGVVVLS